MASARAVLPGGQSNLNIINANRREWGPGKNPVMGEFGR